MGGLMSRNKGKAGEREVRDLMRVAFAGVVNNVEDIRRNHQQAEIGGADLVGVPYYSVEVKRVKLIPWGKGLDDWWGQTCVSAEEDGKWPLLEFRQDRGRWYVMLYSYGTNFGGEPPWVLTKTIMMWPDFLEYVQRFRCWDLE